MNLLERNFRIAVIKELDALNGTEFEYLSTYLFELIVRGDIVHKGHNLQGKPVGWTQDHYTDQFDAVSQCGTDEDYFEDFQKPLKDVQKAISKNPNATDIYLFSNRYATGGKARDLQKEIEKQNYQQKVHVYDSQRISDLIFDNVTATNKIEQILQYLSSAEELYRILPQTNRLPDLGRPYYHRSEEANLAKLLKQNDCIQIYGLSGIGKTALAITLANTNAKDFETIIWIQGDLLSAGIFDFGSVRIHKFGKTINLEYVVSTYRSLVVLDGIMGEVGQIVEHFNRINSRGSKLLITSINKSRSLSAVHELGFLEVTSSSAILRECSVQPTQEQIDGILSQVGGYPLVLDLIRSAIECRDFDWNQILQEANSLGGISDDRGTRLSQRIIGKFLADYSKELGAIKYIDNTKVNTDLFIALISAVGVSELRKRSIIRSLDLDYYDVHPLILNCIKDIINIEALKSSYNIKLFEYLDSLNVNKEEPYYRFLYNNISLLERVWNDATADDTLKKAILYALAQSADRYVNPKRFLTRIRTLSLDFSQYRDVMLRIEQIEIDTTLPRKELSHQEQLELYRQGAQELRSLAESASDPQVQRLLHHHAGKFSFWAKDFDVAIELFKGIIAEDPEPSYARLQLARVFIARKDWGKACKEIEQTLDDRQRWKSLPLAILLSFFDLLGNNALAHLRSKYIDEDISGFTALVVRSINSAYDQPYLLIESLCRHLNYNFPQEFEAICDALPPPDNIEHNEKLRLSYARIHAAYYKYLKYNSSENKELKMERSKLLCDRYFAEFVNKDDYTKSTIVDHYLDRDEINRAYEIAKNFHDMEDNVFNLQKLCKIHKALQEYDSALDMINRAIEKETYREGRRQYLAAFYNDKAEVEFLKRNPECIKTLSVAISYQENDKTLSKWEQKLEHWMTCLQ